MNGKTIRFQGFSLIEIMIVVFIISISASMAVLYIDTADERLKSEAKRLLAMTQLLHDDAIITGRSLALLVGTNHYSFSQLKMDKWQQLNDKPFKKIKLEDDMTIRFIAADNRSDDNADPQQEKKENLFYFLATGESRAFQLWIANKDMEYVLSCSSFGELSLKASLKPDTHL